MKICQILAGNEDGGLEKHTIELSKQLSQRGIDVTVIAHRDFAKDFEGVRFVPMDLSRSRRNPWILYRLFRFLKREGFDIIHAQANKATAMVTTLKPFLRSKIVATLHNYKRDLKAFEKSDFIITVSDKIGEKLQRTTRKTIYNGIAFDEAFPRRDLHELYAIAKDRFVLCSVARFTRVKRLELLIEAVGMLQDVHLILVGAGEEESKLKRMVSDAGLQEKVTFTGGLANREVKTVVSGADLFVMSSDREGFPYTFVEAMFCKTPFVSTPVSDIEKFISAKYTVPFNDAKALAEKIEAVRADYNTVKADFDPVFTRAETEFTVSHMTEQTLSVYRELLL